jgi:hypothetical protein
VFNDGNVGFGDFPLHHGCNEFCQYFGLEPFPQPTAPVFSKASSESDLPSYIYLPPKSPGQNIPAHNEKDLLTRSVVMAGQNAEAGAVMEDSGSVVVEEPGPAMGAHITATASDAAPVDNEVEARPKRNPGARKGANSGAKAGRQSSRLAAKQQ